MSTTTVTTRPLRLLKALRADELSGLKNLPEGSPEREDARKRIAALNAEIQAHKA